jgi:hypothetical protein
MRRPLAGRGMAGPATIARALGRPGRGHSENHSCDHTGRLNFRKARTATSQRCGPAARHLCCLLAGTGQPAPPPIVPSELP